MSNLDDLEKIQKLKQEGILTDKEFKIEKQKILGINKKENVVPTDDTQTNNGNEKNKNITNKSKQGLNKRTFCTGCGNVLEEGDKFCGKCGQKVDNKKDIIKLLKNKVWLAILGVILIIIIVILVINNNQTNESETSDVITNDNSGIASTTEKKYYDFIDTEYMTFNFTESEFISRAMDGHTYTSAGFERNKATTDNTYNYVKVSLSGIQTIHIENDSSNGKVRKILLSVSGTNYTQSDFEEMTTSLLTNLASWTLNTDSSNEEDVAKFASFFEEILREQSVDKGIKYSGSITDNSCSVTFEVIE